MAGLVVILTARYRSFKAVTPVQIRSGLRVKYQVKGLIAGAGGQALDRLSVICP